MPVLVLALSACGGGGGGGGGDGSSSAGTGAGVAAAPGAAPGAVVTAPSTVAVTGIATYDAVPNLAGALSYSAVVAKPIRGASVDVVSDAGTVLASTRTDETGAYAVSIPPNVAVLVRIKAQMLQTGGAGSWDVTVRDNTRADAVYALETPLFRPDAQGAVRNVAAASGWNGSTYGATRAAGPFAILDTIRTLQAKVLSVAPATAFPPLRMFWSVDNRPAVGTASLGEIGTTSFESNASGYAIYVVGKENVDTDEYDASVIAHEWGHYYQSALGRDDSPGGDHSFADRLDRRLAFSEGWGNAWAGIGLDRSDYTDSIGPRQAIGGRIDLATGPTTDPGWYREGSIQSVLWRLNRAVGFKPLHDTFTGAFRRGAAVTSIHPFAAAFAATSPGNAATLAGLLSSQNISAAPNDPYGLSETNDGGVPEALPMYRSAAVGATTQACLSYRAGTNNRLGNQAYLRFTAPTARTYAIIATGQAGTDPDFSIQADSLVAGGQGDVAPFGGADVVRAGNVVITLSDYNLTTATPCFTVAIQ